MKLICHPISPYARKTMILAHLHGIKVEMILPEKNGSHGYKAGDNPLGKIPALEWKPGQYLFDSPVICEYLDSLSDTPILPTDPHQHMISKCHHALGDGLADAVYNYRYETVRPKELHWEGMILRHESAVKDVIMRLDTMCDELGGPWSYGNLAIITALDYASFRAGHIDWREISSKLAAWHAGFVGDAAYQATYDYPR